MDYCDAIRERHSVRKYLDRPIEAEKIEKIQQLIDECNRDSGLNIQFVTNEPLAFSTGLFKYGAFSGVRNYLAFVAPKNGNYKEAIGYYGQKIVLLMQMLGLNSCWVALTFKNIKNAYKLREGEELKLVVACGYGTTNGVQHPQNKRLEELYIDNRTQKSLPLPDWFLRGMEAAMLAPTSLNKQKFIITLHDGIPSSDNSTVLYKVSAKAKFDLFGYAPYDLGIVKCNFELAAGKENFEWV